MACVNLQSNVLLKYVRVDLGGNNPFHFCRDRGMPPHYFCKNRVAVCGHPATTDFPLTKCLRPSIENSWISSRMYFVYLYLPDTECMFHLHIMDDVDNVQLKFTLFTGSESLSYTCKKGYITMWAINQTCSINF